MRWHRLTLALLIQVGLVLPTYGGIFSAKKDKIPPAQRVPELIGILKTDPSESKRAAAAEELRQFDTKQFPEVSAILMDAVLHDAKPDVRAEAVQSLSRLRPISQEAGWTLEQAAGHDASIRVRIHARTALWQYHLAGYRSAKPEGPVVNKVTTHEPPLARDMPPGKGQSTSTFRPSTWFKKQNPDGMTSPTPQVISSEPPLLTPPTVEEKGPELNIPR